MPITTDVVSSNLAHYVIKFVSDLRQVVVFSTNKTDRHDITEILLKVALNTINQSIHTCVLIFCSNQISDMATMISPMKTYIYFNSQQK